MEREKPTSGSLLEPTAKWFLSSDPIEETAEDRESRELLLSRKRLLAKLQLLGDCLVTICIGRVQVIEQAAALANHDQQAASRTVIFLVALEVFGETINAIGQ